MDGEECLLAVAGGGAWEVALVRQLEEYISAKGVVRYDFVTASQECYTPHVHVYPWLPILSSKGA